MDKKLVKKRVKASCIKFGAN